MFYFYILTILLIVVQDTGRGTSRTVFIVSKHNLEFNKELKAVVLSGIVCFVTDSSFVSIKIASLM